MYITHSFAGTTVGPHSYLFFALYKDYIDLDRAFVQEFEVHLERLARDLGDHGAVVKSFPGDIEHTRKDLLSKRWSQPELEEVMKTPSLLVLDVDFDDFSPQQDHWLLMHFGEGSYGGANGLSELAETLKAIADATGQGRDNDLYTIVREMAQSQPNLAEVFEAKPGLFGFSIDVIRAGAALRTWLQSRRRPVTDSHPH